MKLMFTMVVFTPIIQYIFMIMIVFIYNLKNYLAIENKQFSVFYILKNIFDDVIISRNFFITFALDIRMRGISSDSSGKIPMQ